MVAYGWEDDEFVNTHGYEQAEHYDYVVYAFLRLDGLIENISRMFN